MKTLSPGLGSLNVIIGGKPAWRALLDFHACPSSTSRVSHVGGFVMIGSTTVFINKVPAARKGDRIIEIGPPNTITTGKSNVLIGG